MLPFLQTDMNTLMLQRTKFKMILLVACHAPNLPPHFQPLHQKRLAVDRGCIKKSAQKYKILWALVMTLSIIAVRAL